MCYMTYARLYFDAKAKTPKTRKSTFAQLGAIFPQNKLVEQTLFLKHMSNVRFIPGQLVSSLDPNFAAKCNAIREYGHAH